jgi:hypothetical protein
MIAPLLLWVTLSVEVARAADCAAPVTTIDLQRALEDAEAAYVALDDIALSVAGQTVQNGIPCLNEPMSRTLAASIHRFVGLQSFLDRELDDAALAYAAARSIEPAYVLPLTLVPEGHPLRDVYASVDLGRDARVSVPEAKGRLTFDGRESDERPSTWPTIVQVFDEQGRVLSTTYLLPDAPMPEYTPAEGRLSPDTFELKFQTPPNRTLLMSAGGAAVAAGGLYALAAVSANRYHNVDPPDANLDALRATTNGLTVATWGVGVAAATLGVGAFFVGQW